VFGPLLSSGVVNELLAVVVFMLCFVQLLYSAFAVRVDIRVLDVLNSNE